VAVYDQVVSRLSLAPAARTNGTANGTAVNLGAYGAESATVNILTGTITDGSHAFSIEESATGTGSWSAVPAGRLSTAVPTVTSANSNTQFEVGVLASAQFLRVNCVTTGATTGGLSAAAVVVGDVQSTPVSHA
jgi:hypothetical protein